MGNMFAVPARLDFLPCRYEGSPLFFRGPAAVLDGAHVAVLGGTTAFGRGVGRPYPALLAGHLGLPVANLGIPNAGPDLLLSDPAIRRIAQQAAVTVVELPDGWNLTNVFYRVHPRRNDRVVSLSGALRRLFPEADFSEVHFTRHLMAVLRGIDPARATHVERLLAKAWTAQMQRLLVALPRGVVLLWVPRQGAPGACRWDMAQAVAQGLPLVQAPVPAAPGPCPEALGPEVHAAIARALLPRLVALQDA